MELGLQGSHFTDPIRLEEVCGLANTFHKKPELSSVFIYDVISKFEGPNNFYDKFMITSLCPLGFTKNEKNYNYYDDKKLEIAAKSKICENIYEKPRI